VFLLAELIAFYAAWARVSGPNGAARSNSVGKLMSTGSLGSRPCIKK
jgi:hypothetical protein